MQVSSEYQAMGVTPAPPPVGAAHDAAVHFVLELARALHAHGTPAHRLEAALDNVAIRLGLEAQFFSTPTSIMVGIGPLMQQHVHLLRVEPGAPNLGHLSRLSAITRDVVVGDASPDQGSRHIAVLLAAPPRWPTWLQIIAFVLSSVAVAGFLKVQRNDLAIAGLLGLVTGCIAIFASRHESWTLVVEPLAAFAVATIAFTFDVLTRNGSGFLTSLAGLVVLLPGLTFTVALTELSTRHLASGTARLSGAMVVFLGLGFGIALGAKAGIEIGSSLSLTAAMHHWPFLTLSGQLPAWFEWVSLLIAPLAFTVLLKAEARDAGIIVVASASAYLTSRYSGSALGEELGAFLGAVVISAGSNISARVLRRSAMVTIVPGLLVLVPGSIGFRSVTSLLGQQVEAGVATAFRLAIIGISLAAGILAGNVVTAVFERRRELPNT